jgi:hypothetical protein
MIVLVAKIPYLYNTSCSLNANPFLWNPIKENTTNKIENTGITAPIISQTLSEKISV